MNKSKLYVLMAHRAEYPYEKVPKFPMETEFIFFGIGKEAAVNAAVALSKRIQKEKKECRVLLVGSCGSFTCPEGWVIYDKNIGPLRYYEKYCVASLKTVDRLISKCADDEDWLSKYDAFDMEAHHFFEAFDRSNPYVMDLSCIKVVSDSGADSMEEWEKSVKEIHDDVASVIETYAEWDSDEGVQDLAKVYPDFPKKGVNFVDLFPTFTHRNLNRFAEWLDNELVKPIMLCPESRGMLLGSAVTALLDDAYFVPVRKSKKLPGETIRFNSCSEYGVEELAVSEAHLRNAFEFCTQYGTSEEIPVVIVDDVLATGGTAEAIFSAIHGRCVETSEGIKIVRVHGFYFFTEIEGLKGKELLQRHNIPVKVFMKI